MKEFKIHTMPIESPETGQKLIGGLRLSSCELASRIRAVELSKGSQIDTRIRIEEGQIEGIPKWVLDY
tara:strand:- start:247 stop:450 length:204 start_codon:yes stop_codon:yes gene_type:complete